MDASSTRSGEEIKRRLDLSHVKFALHRYRRKQIDKVYKLAMKLVFRCGRAALACAADWLQKIHGLLFREDRHLRCTIQSRVLLFRRINVLRRRFGSGCFRFLFLGATRPDACCGIEDSELYEDLRVSQGFNGDFIALVALAELRWASVIWSRIRRLISHVPRSGVCRGHLTSVRR